ncbi:MAG: hypothetical protein E6860_04760 [Clostridium sp.]|uniref:hypothetical protein n=1 Tax=Clostridium sp. TaxID=1506 RepID=UPI0028FE17B8|nr:hypothetical protein [Clostridium sp.]MDU1584842.1 hypothetical protein [Clostridium sp.]
MDVEKEKVEFLKRMINEIINERRNKDSKKFDIKLYQDQLDTFQIIKHMYLDDYDIIENSNSNLLTFIYKY